MRDVVEGALLGEADRLRIGAQDLQQRARKREAALDDHPCQPIGPRGRELDRRRAAERAAHDQQRPGAPLPGEGVDHEVQHAVRVPHHGGDRGAAGRTAVAAVVHRQEPDPEALIIRRDVVVVGDDFPVAVEEQNVRRGGRGRVEACPEGHPVRDRDQEVGRPGGRRRRAIFAARVEQAAQHRGTVEDGVVR